MTTANDWKVRHDTAYSFPTGGHERGIVNMVRGWVTYADAHVKMFEAPISEDYVLGPEWLAIGKALIGLLDGHTGNRLDCGTLDGLIRDTATKHGFTEEM